MAGPRRGRQGRTEDLTRALCASLEPGSKKYRISQVGRPGLKFVVEPDGRKYWTFRYVTRVEILETCDLVARGEVWPLVTVIRPLQEAEAVHDLVERGQVTGRAVLRVA